MKLIIEIEMDNDAFTGYGRRKEVKRIFKEEVLSHLELHKEGEMRLHDINGNTVGFAKVVK
ncbi:MAG: hypothetical protein OK454_02085 [Thaumarchaeota archaeon]|nr:hypothetical protein [Nitrososphaerota archaeon]